MYGDLNLPFPEFLRNRPGSPAGFNQGGFGSGGGGGLVRHSSSPAGFFANLNVENGFGGVRNIAEFQSSGSVASTVDSSMPSGRLKGQISFSSGQGSTGLMSQISELCNDIDGNCPEEVDAGGVGSRNYIPGFQATSWEDSGLLSDSFPSRKRVRDHLETHNGEARNHARSLTHQFSLPNERFLHFEESTPWKIRAKRGCATHPRSIAERVRRTRISERIRKLQELVPNMDKQTSISDMLELAVDYIKQLQRQTEKLESSRTSCTCSSNHIKLI